MQFFKEPIRFKYFLMQGVAAFAALATSNPVLAQDAQTSIRRVDDIIVTARRKEERNQDVPVSITAFGNERLAEMRIVNTQSLQATVPSLVVGSNGQASRETQSPTIRGQGATFQASPGVAVYLAEAPLPSTLSLSMQGGPGNYLDLQNVQVLKGPQGTLFGRNTTGGAVLLSPQKPTDKVEGYFQVQGGNYNDREVQAVVNIPVIEDKLLVRFAGEIVDRDGYTKDINFNKDRDDRHYWTGRLGVTWRPSDKFENYLMVYDTWSRTNGAGAVGRGFNLPAFAGVYGQCDTAFTGPCSDYQRLVDEQNARGPRKVSHSTDDFSKIETWGINNISDWQLTDNLTLRNIANYTELKNFSVYDGDGYSTVAFENNIFTGRQTPSDNIKQYSEELQLQGKALGGRLDYVLGGFYFKNEPNGAQAAGGLNLCPLAFSAFCSDPGPTGDGALSLFHAVVKSEVTSESYAGYGQGTYDLGGLVQTLDGLRLTLGYRYTWDKIDGSASTYRYNGAGYDCLYVGVTAVTPAGCTTSASLESSRPTWTAGLDYKLPNGTLLYGKVSRGYKSGGFNVYSVRPETRVFGPEEVTSYEAGFKSDFEVAERPVRLNVTAFYTGYDKIQRTAGDFNPATLATGAQTFSSAKAEIRGVEIESVIKPMDSLELGVNYSHLDAEYKKYDYDAPIGVLVLEDCDGKSILGTGGTANMKCLPLQYLSPNIVNVYGRYNFTPDMSLFVSYSWTDDQHTEGLVLEKFQPGERLESYELVNASFDWKRVAGSNVDLSVFATNLFDETYRISNSDSYPMGSLGIWSTLYGEPRMVGARIRYSWGD